MDPGTSEPFTSFSSNEHVIRVHFGVHSGSQKFSIERQAVNEASFRCPDELGWQPQSLKLSTVDGEFEILVNILPSSFHRNSSPFNWIVIGDSLNISSTSLLDTSSECTPVAPTHPSLSANRDKLQPTKPISYRDILVGTSTAPITHFEKEPLDTLRHNNWGQQSRRSTTSKRTNWAWFPKVQLSSADSSSSCPLRSPAPNPINSNSNSQHSSLHLAPAQLAGTLDPLPAIFQDELDEDTPLRLLIEKRLKVARELGLNVDGDKGRTAALFKKSILSDINAEAISKQHHLDHIEDLVNEIPLSEAEIEISRAKSYETPVVFFPDPTHWWENSQIREDFLIEDADFLTPGFEISSPPPPGFETPRLRRKGTRLHIYQRIDEGNQLLNEAFSLRTGEI